MGAQLNIEGEDADRLASRLSELTGESLTAGPVPASDSSWLNDENGLPN